MDSQDHGKNHTTGHESHGAHVCHRCGWSFPNPHPSAKQRRAHKKVCGTVEGYKLTDAENKTHLDVADEEQLSDEDHKASGNSELGDIKINENVKNEIHRAESSRSEEGVFSNAVTEDTGSNPSNETVVAKGAQITDVNVTAGIIQEPEHPMQGSQLQNCLGLEISVDNLKNNVQFQDVTSSSTIGSTFSSDKKTKALAVDATEGRNDSANLIPSVKPEEPVNVIHEITNTQFGDDLTDRSRMHFGQSYEGQQHENGDAGVHSPHMVLSPSKPASVEIDSKLEQMNDFAGVNTDVSITRMNGSVPIDRPVESKEEQSNFSEPVPIQINSSSNSCSGPMEVVGIEHMDTLTNRESNSSGQEVDIVYPGEAVGHDTKAQPNEKIATLLIPTVISAESHSDMATKDCRDHGPGTSDGHGEPIKEMEDHPKSLVSDEDHSRLSESDEDDVCSAQRVLEENRQKQGTVGNSMVEESCIECKTDNSECKVAMSPDDGSNGAEDLPDALGSDQTSTHTEQIQMVCSTEKKVILPERTIVIHERGGAAMVSPADTEVDGASYAISNSNLLEKATISTGDESDGLGALPDALSSEITSTDRGLTQTVCSIEKQGPYDSHNDSSQEIPPEKPRVIHETHIADMDSPADTVFDGATTAISNSEFLDKATISTGDRTNALEALPDSEILPEKPTDIPEAGADPMVSSATTKVDGASDAFSSSDDFPEKARTDNSNLSGKDVGEGVVEVSRSEDLQECPKGVDISGCTDSSSVSMPESQVENDDTNFRVSEHVHEDIKVSQDNSRLFQSGAENLRPDEHIVPNSGSWVPSSVAVEDNNANDLSGDVTDTNSQSLQDDGDHSLKHQLGADALAVVHREFSVNSDDQTDHMEGYSDSVSEGMVSSTTNASNEQVTVSAETLQMPDIHANEADLKRTLAEGNTGYGRDKSDMKSESLLGKGANNHQNLHPEGTVPSMTIATDELVILAAETFRASDIQAQKVDLKKTLGEESTVKDFGEDTFEIQSRSIPNGVNNLLKQKSSVLAVVPADASVDSSSQTDSVEGHWGSVSDGRFPSNRDANEERAINVTETLVGMGVADKDQRANSETKIGASQRQHSNHSDIFDAPSFMTLVEPGSRGNDQKTASSEIQAIQNTQQTNSSFLQAGWFPSLTHDATESEGRRKNEEIIAKVSNWSVGKQHTPLRSLLVEANLESKQKKPNAPKDEASAQEDNLPAKTSPPMTAPEVSTAFTSKGDEEKEWDKPARLPESKKEKRKARGNWVPFVCCSSVD